MAALAAVLLVPAACLAADIPFGDTPLFDGKTLGQRSVCALVESAATENGLPIDYFTRLIWRESAFRPDAVSPKGALGIAQFMPGTASDRGLADPMDPNRAIPASAAYLRALADQFGNLGLAAAAYNAGPDRVNRWLAGSGVLPLETEGYVIAITGKPANDWKEAKASDEDPDDDPATPTCLDVVGRIGSKATPPAVAAPPSAPFLPWGAQVAGNFSLAKARSDYADLQKRFPAVLGGREPLVRQVLMRSFGTKPMFQLRIPAETRAGADDICRRLNAAGGSCVVFKN